MKSDTLQTLIDWDNIMSMPRCSGGHDDQMKGLFKGATVIAHYNEGGYEGTVATAVRLADGRFCWYQDSFGSCPGCDLWEDADDDDIRKLCVNLACDAEVFDTFIEMINHMLLPDPRSFVASAKVELSAMCLEKTSFRRITPRTE